MILDINYSLIIKELNKNPELEKKFMTNDYFLRYILKDKAMILKYLPLLKKYHIENEEVKKAINNFNNILEVHPELSLGNTSLTYEFLEDDFQKILGIDFISGILAYDTEASKIAVDLYKQNKLAN